MNKRTPDAIASSSKSPAVTTPLEMNFHDALLSLTPGEKVTRIIWDNINWYVSFGPVPGFTGEWLHIHVPFGNSLGLEPGFFTWKINDGDWHATDYIVVKKGVIQ